MKNKAYLLIVLVESPTRDNAEKEKIQSRANTSSYDEGWDRTFGNKKPQTNILN